MQRFTGTRSVVSMAVFATALITILTPLARAQVGHGAAILRRASGPTGLPVAHVGETVTSVIRVRNIDDFNDSVIVTSIVCVVHHATGDVMVANLLPAPAVLSFFGEFMSVAFTYPVLPTDGDLLTDHATAGAIDTFDSEEPPFRARSFTVSYPAQIRVLRPCLQVAKECGTANGQAAGITTLTNCGNCMLTNVIVSNIVNGIAVRVFGPVGLEAGQGARFTDSYPDGVPAAEIVSARGTDETGLTVSQTTTASCSTAAAEAVSLRLGPGAARNKLAMSFPSRAGKSYTVQWSDSLTSWQTLSNFTGNGSILHLEQNAAHPRRFYRVVMNP